jgi:hypothetical protein
MHPDRNALDQGDRGQDFTAQGTSGEVRLYDAPYYGGWEMHLGDGNAVPATSATFTATCDARTITIIRHRHSG